MHVSILNVDWFTPDPNALGATLGGRTHFESSSFHLVQEHVESKGLACSIGPAKCHNSNLATDRPQRVQAFLANFILREIPVDFHKLNRLIWNTIWIDRVNREI
jgi:hypothetical protein